MIHKSCNIILKLKYIFLLNGNFIDKYDDDNCDDDNDDDGNDDDDIININNSL